jgi:predicted GNAT family acetyltransferase
MKSLTNATGSPTQAARADPDALIAQHGEVIDNPAMHRFELPIGGEVAVAYYRIEDGRMVFTHTEVPFGFSGQGYGSKLARAAFETARSRGMHVIAKCAFMSNYALKYPEYTAPTLDDTVGAFNPTERISGKMIMRGRP